MQASLKDYYASFRTASWESIWYSATPVSASLVVWQFKLVNVILGLGTAFMVLRPGGLLAELRSNNLVTARHFRFKAVQLRAADLPVDSPGIGSLSILRDGCKLPSEHTSLRIAQDGMHVYLSSAVVDRGTPGRRGQASAGALAPAGDPLSINGFGFHTPGAGTDPARDAVEFEFAHCHNLVRISLPLQTSTLKPCTCSSL